MLNQVNKTFLFQGIGVLYLLFIASSILSRNSPSPSSYVNDGIRVDDVQQQQIQQAQEQEIIVPTTTTEDAQQIPLPKLIEENFADLGEVPQEGDTPVFWHVLKSGGTTIKDMYAKCSGLVMASEVGGLNGHDKDKELSIITLDDGSRYVNVDTITPKGISRAIDLHLAESNLANLITASHIHAISQMFTPQYRGRMFALFRHPVDRVVSLFYHMRFATWEPAYDKAFETMTLDQFADKYTLKDSNIMVRILSKNTRNKITQKDIAVAKEILRRKVLVGLINQMEESVRRFDLYFGFEQDVECKKAFVNVGSNRHEHPVLDHFGETYDKLKGKNWADMILYEYAEQLFEEQAVLVGGNVIAPPPPPPQQQQEEKEKVEVNAVAQPQGGDGSGNQNGLLLPEAMEANIADITNVRKGDTPLFWFLVGQYGSAAVRDIYSNCANLVIAGAAGTHDGHDQDKEIAIVDIKDGTRYVNVDTTSLEGIARAQQLGLAQSGLANLVIAPLIHEVSEIFTPQKRGVIFALFQNPVNRVVDRFYFLQQATWLPTYDPSYATMTLNDYAASTLMNSNVLVRNLSRNIDNAITMEDIDIAKEIIRRKCLVGLVEQMEESIRRFDTFFQLGSGNNENAAKCTQSILQREASKNNYPVLDRSDPTWDFLRKQNWADMRLYAYVEQLFMEQGQLMFSYDNSQN